MSFPAFDGKIFERWHIGHDKEIYMSRKVWKFLKDNSLSLILFALFLMAFVGEMSSGWNNYNDQQASHHQPTVSFGDFLTTGTFLDSAFCNWQAAILQLAVLIVFSEEFYQRGASHSRKPGGESRQHHSRNNQQRSKSEKQDGKKQRQKQRSWLYRNSLALAFWTLFLIFFALHLIFAAASYNESRATQHLSPMSLLDFTTAAKFWFLTLQTWEAEFFAIAVFIVLTIFLRQQNSPESKSPESSDKDTGEPNE